MERGNRRRKGMKKIGTERKKERKKEWIHGAQKYINK